LFNANAIFQLSIYHGENKFLMRWWWGMLCTRPTCWVGYL